MAEAQHGDPLEAFRSAMIMLVRRKRRDLTARQLAALLTCYLKPDPQTVRGLATELNVGRPELSRVVDRLAGYKLIRRQVDTNDRRSILLERTMVGEAFVRDLRTAMTGSTPKSLNQSSAPATWRRCRWPE